MHVHKGKKSVALSAPGIQTLSVSRTIAKCDLRWAQFQSYLVWRGQLACPTPSMGLGLHATQLGVMGIDSPYPLAYHAVPKGLLRAVPTKSLMQFQAACVRLTGLEVGVRMQSKCQTFIPPPSLAWATFLLLRFILPLLSPTLHASWTWPTSLASIGPSQLLHLCKCAL